jgi:hypothetical protein
MMTSSGPFALTPHSLLCHLLRHEGVNADTDPNQLLFLATQRLRRLAAKHSELAIAIASFSGGAAAADHVGVAEGPYSF